MTIYFTSDTHFGHANIITYCDRPFGSVHEMNEELIKRWNESIQPDDDVYHLGDFGMGRRQDLPEIRRRLNGNVHLILGNHDDKMPGDLKNQFVWIKNYYELSVPDSDGYKGRQGIVLCHYGFEVWNGSHRGIWHLHGHSHGSLLTPDTMRRLDTGVDSHDFSPVSYAEVKDIMATRQFKPIDQHKEK